MPGSGEGRVEDGESQTVFGSNRTGKRRRRVFDLFDGLLGFFDIEEVWDVVEQKEGSLSNREK